MGGTPHLCKKGKGGSVLLKVYMCISEQSLPGNGFPQLICHASLGIASFQHSYGNLECNS